MPNADGGMGLPLYFKQPYPGYPNCAPPPDYDYPVIPPGSATNGNGNPHQMEYLNMPGGYYYNGNNGHDYYDPSLQQHWDYVQMSQHHNTGMWNNGQMPLYPSPGYPEGIEQMQHHQISYEPSTGDLSIINEGNGNAENAFRGDSYPSSTARMPDSYDHSLPTANTNYGNSNSNQVCTQEIIQHGESTNPVPDRGLDKTNILEEEAALETNLSSNSVV